MVSSCRPKIIVRWQRRVAGCSTIRSSPSGWRVMGAPGCRSSPGNASGAGGAEPSPSSRRSTRRNRRSRARARGRADMCGLAAVFKRHEVACAAGVVLAMRDEARHRGPDDEGAVFLDRRRAPLARPEAGESGWTVALGHRRLSILDLSAAGHQPMAYGDRYWVIHNGEIYNYVELRAELGRAGHVFRSASDTEVILAAFAEWGTDCFRRLRGMWGLVIVDTARGEAVMSRDRLGIKPLYFWRGNGLLAVASEIKQLLCLPGFRARLDAR